MRIAVKEVGKALQIVETSEKYRTKAVQVYTDKHSNDLVEFVRLTDNQTFAMGVNEEGMLFDLPVNFLMSMNNHMLPIHEIYGTAVFVRSKYANPFVEEIYDYEVEDLTDADIEFIQNEILNEDIQRKLRERYVPSPAMRFFTW